MRFQHFRIIYNECIKNWCKAWADSSSVKGWAHNQNVKKWYRKWTLSFLELFRKYSSYLIFRNGRSDSCKSYYHKSLGLPEEELHRQILCIHCFLFGSENSVLVFLFFKNTFHISYFSQCCENSWTESHLREKKQMYFVLNLRTEIVQPSWSVWHGGWARLWSHYMHTQGAVRGECMNVGSHVPFFFYFFILVTQSLGWCLRVCHAPIAKPLWEHHHRYTQRYFS